MNALSVKLPADLHATLSREAQRRNVTRSTLVREIIGNALGDSLVVKSRTVPSWPEIGKRTLRWPEPTPAR